MLDEYECILTPEEVSKIFRVSPNYVYHLLKTGKLNAFRSGRNWKIPKVAVTQYIMNQINKPSR